MSRALLDVSVLLPLLDADHAEHAAAQEWLARDAADGWASCAVTENGFVRIVSQPRYPAPVSPLVAAERLEYARTHSDHEFWPCDVSILDAADLRRVHGAAQVTDAYLLALAVAHDGRLVTFDRRITLAAVPDAAARHLVQL